MKKSAVIVSVVALVVFAVGVGLWQLFATPAHDDINYGYICLDTCEDDFWELRGGPLTTFSEAVESASNHWMLVNGRLANAIMVFAVLLPPWLLSAIQAMMAAGMMLLVLFYGLGRKALNCSWLCALLPLAGWKLFPWFDNFSSDDYMMNYVWSCVLVLAFLWPVLHPRSLSSPLRMAGACLLGLAAGMMHEGFSVPVCFALAALWLWPSALGNSDIPTKEWRRRMLFPALAFVAGTAFCVFAPSTLDRAMRGDVRAAVSVLDRVRFFAKYLLPLYLYAALCAAVWWKRGFAALVAELKKRAFWFVVIAFVMLLMAATGALPARMMMFPDAVLLILCLRMLLALVGDNLRPLKGLAAVFVMVQAVFFAAVLPYQYRIGKASEECTAEFRERADGRVHCDIDALLGDSPWWSFGIVTYNPPNYIYARVLKSIPNYKHRNGVTALVLPEGTEKMETFGDFPPVPGENPFRGLFPMVLSRDSIAEGTVVEADFGEMKNNVFPLKRGNFKPGRYKIEVKCSNLVPALEPDTVYAIYFRDPTDRMHYQNIDAIYYTPVTE